MCETYSKTTQGKWMMAGYTLVVWLVIGVILSRIIIQSRRELPNKGSTNAFCLVTNAFSLPTNDVKVLTNILWTASHPLIAMWTTNGLQPIPATGCELGLREDGVIVWRQVINRPINPVAVVTNVAPTQQWSTVSGSTSEWRTVGMSSNAVPKKKRKWFGW